MADRNGDETLAKSLTVYLLNTTELRPRPSVHAVWAVLNGAVVAGHRPRHKPDAQCLVMSTGSVAELYIEPLAQCFGDYDTMYHFSDMLALPAGHPLPRRLPAEFHRDVNLYEITDSHVAGYVYLVLKYVLSQRDDGTYSWSLYDDDDDNDDLYDKLAYTFLLHSERADHRTHGPATVDAISNILNVITGRPDEPDVRIMSLDWVYSVRCLVWPPQAAGWACRPRPHGCPDSSTVDLIVSDGCHLVPVAHRLCRSNKWIGDRQWRLSFSKAELKLMNDWTPIQQLVYHVLRSVLKIAKVTDDDGAIVSNYHVKTLMLWATELHTAGWWSTGDTCLITAASSLLDALACCLAERCCQHYFVDGANLFLRITEDQTCSVEPVLAKLRSISDADQLASLMLNKYVWPCILQVCPNDVVRLFYGGGTLDEGLSAVSAWRCSTLREKSWRSMDSCSHGIERCVYEMSLTARSCCYFLERLNDVENRLVDHFVGVACLHVAYTLATRNTRKLQHMDQLFDVVSIAVSWPCDTSTWRRGNHSAMTKATVLLKAVSNTSYETRCLEQLIQVELSKAYLYSELDDNVSCAAHAYLAAVYFEEEQYELAIDHCRLVQTSEARRQFDDAIQTEVLLNIYPVDNVLGVAVLYQFLRARVMPSVQQQCFFGVLSTHLFAHILHVLCLRDNTGKVSEQLQRYKRSLLGCKRPLIADILLFKLTTAEMLVRVCDRQPSNDQRGRNVPPKRCSSKLLRLLTQLAVERLTTFREVQTRDFGGDVVPGTTDFLAMYAFRRRVYGDCMRLCQTNIEKFADCDTLQEIFMLPEFVFLLGDCDLVCIIGLALLVYPEARGDPNCQFAFRLSQLSLALYMYAECQLRLHHSVKSLQETWLCANVVSKRHPPYATLSAWTLQLIKHKITDRLKTAR